MPSDFIIKSPTKKKTKKHNLSKLLLKSPVLEEEFSESGSDEELSLSDLNSDQFKSDSSGIFLFRGLNSRKGKKAANPESLLGKPLLSSAAKQLALPPEEALKLINAHVSTFSETKNSWYFSRYVNNYSNLSSDEAKLLLPDEPQEISISGPLGVSTTFSAREAMHYALGHILSVQQAIEKSTFANYTVQGSPAHRIVGTVVISFVPKNEIPSLHGIYVRSQWAQKKLRIRGSFVRGDRQEYIIPGGLPGKYVSGAYHVVFPDFTKKYGIRLYRAQNTTMLDNEDFLNTIHGSALVIINKNTYLISDKKIISTQPIDIDEALLEKFGFGKIVLNHENYGIGSIIIEEALSLSGKKEAFAKAYEEKYGLNQNQFEEFRSQFAEIYQDSLKNSNHIPVFNELTKTQYKCRLLEGDVREHVVKHHIKKLNKLVTGTRERLFPSLLGGDYQEYPATFRDAADLRPKKEKRARDTLEVSCQLVKPLARPTGSVKLAKAHFFYSKYKYESAIKLYAQLFKPQQLEKFLKMDFSSKAATSILVNRIPNGYLHYAKAIYYQFIEDKILVNSFEDLQTVVKHGLTILRILENKNHWEQMPQVHENQKEMRPRTKNIETKELLYALLIMVNNSISLCCDVAEQKLILDVEQEKGFADSLMDLSTIALYVIEAANTWIHAYREQKDILVLEKTCNQVKILLESLADSLYDALEEKEEQVNAHSETFAALYNHSYQCLRHLDEGDEIFDVRQKETALLELRESIESFTAQSLWAKSDNRPQ